MKNHILIACLSIAFLNFTLTEATNPPTLNLDIQELERVEGQYTRTMEYLNYSDEETRVTLNMTASFNIKGNKIKVTNVFDEGNGRTETRKGYYLIKDNKIDGHALAEKMVDGDAMKLVWYQKGKDGNQHKAATFRFTIDGNGETLSIRKEVLFKGETTYFTRNLTLLTKV